MTSHKAKNENLLKEYEIANEFFRHHDLLGWTIISIFVPVSYVLLGSYIYMGHHLLALAVASITINLVSMGMFLRMSYYNNARLSRIFELEKLLGMDHHRHVDRELKHMDVGIVGKIRMRIITIHKLKWFQLIGLIIAWLLITIN